MNPFAKPFEPKTILEPTQYDKDWKWHDYHDENWTSGYDAHSRSNRRDAGWKKQKKHKPRDNGPSTLRVFFSNVTMFGKDAIEYN